MYSKTYALRKPKFNFIMHILTTALWGRQRQILNGYFSVNNRNNFYFLTATETADTRKRGIQEIVRNGKALTEKIDFSISNSHYQINVIPSSSMRTNF